MHLILNGESTQVAAGVRLSELVPDPRGVAVAINGAVVRRTVWPETELHEHDRVEVVSAHQGG